MQLRAVFAVGLLTVAASGRGTPSAPRVVEIKSADGTVLKGTHFPAGKPGPGVLLWHQSNRTRKSWDGLAAQLAAAGIDVLAVDARGHGESGGDGSKGRTTWWPQDLDAAFEFLVAQPGVRRNAIGLGGAGVIGVENAVETARRHPAAVQSLVLMSGETDREGLEFLHRSPQLPGLFVVSDGDEYPPISEAMQLLYVTASSPSKKLVHYVTAEEAPWLWYEPFDVGKVPPSGNHGTDLFQSHADLRGIVVRWFATTLLKTPGHAPADPLAAADVLDRLQAPGGAAEVAKQLRRARVNDPQAQLFPEVSASIVGQDFMRAGAVKDAIDVLELVAVAYPDSADAHENLAEAYLKDSHEDLAREHAEKSLAILDTPKVPASSWTNTEQYRGEIRQGAQKVLQQAAKMPRATTPGAPGKPFRDCAECPEMVVIPAGRFTMGSSDAEKAWVVRHGGDRTAVADEAPQHEVALPSFALGRYPVTRAEYAAFARETRRAAGDGCHESSMPGAKTRTGAGWQDPGFAQSERDPVVCVSWSDAQAYVAWLNRKAGRPYRLPTEAEWEYAARAGTSTTFWWGDDDAAAADNAWFKGNSGGRTRPVGTKPANAFGLHDMGGNVWQWTQDCYAESYVGAPSDPRPNEGKSDCLRVDRGGSWMYPAWLLRPATRERNPPDFRDVIMGFRVARSLR